MKEKMEGYGYEDAGMHSSDMPTDWKEAIPCLASARIAIIRAEFRDALGVAISKLVMGAVALFFMILCWLMILVSLVGLIVDLAGWKWYTVTFLTAGIHGVFALIAIRVVKLKRVEQVFPITKAEFEKDVEWLKELKRK